MNVTMLTLRLIHVLSGVFWAGSLFMTAGFLLPAVRATGPAGGQFMRQLVVVRKLPAVTGTAAILTILSGSFMYWRIASISAGQFVHSPMGIALGLGGTAAVLALIPGLGIVARTGGAIAKLGEAIHASGGPPTAEQAATMSRLQQRMRSGAHATAGLVGIALVAMAVARYV